MKFGFAATLFLLMILIIVGAFAYLALVDVPVEQQEIVVDVPPAQ